MNNPLVPQGSLLEQKNKGRARVKIAVFLVLAIHGIGLFALLMQGCNKAPDTSTPPTAQEATPTNPPPAFAEATNPPPALDTNPPALASNPPTMAAAPATSAPPATMEQPQPQPATPPVTPTTGAGTDYKVAKGDILASIAKKNHVSLKALLDANPGIQPTKLKVGQTIHIPVAGTTAAPASTSNVAGAPAPEELGGSQTYTVKSGDSLTKIAARHGVSVKALRAANNLKTDRIVVGQKLKIPAGKAPKHTATGAAETAPQPAPSTGTTPTQPGQ